MSSLSDAIDLLEAGDWQAAHRIVQQDKSPMACWAHGIVHLMEGDRSNAGYWYGRAGRRLRDNASVQGEIGALKARAGLS